MRLLTVLLAAAIMLALATPAAAVPEAGHVRIDATVLRLHVNDYTTRYQLKLAIALSAASGDELVGASKASLSVFNSAGDEACILPKNVQQFPRRFKAAQAKLLFKASEDTADRSQNSVPAGFFQHEGEYSFVLTVLDGEYAGAFSFGEPLAMSVTQQGAPVVNFALMDEQPFTVTTAPVQFGPVYYRKQDLAGYVFQLANMMDSLESGDYHTPRESPRYLFQLSVSDGEGGPSQLVDPAGYIDGWQEHMIRSEQTSTPLAFKAAEFRSGDVVILDFMRESFAEPDTGITAPHDSFSCQLTVQERVLYTLHVEPPPTPEQLGLPEDTASADG